MYKIHHAHNDTDIIVLGIKRHESPYVIEIGHSRPEKGYKSQYLTRNVYVLHFVLQGKGRYYDFPVNGPCVFLETPDTVHYYEVDRDPDAPQWEQYWIMISGSGAGEWLADAGFPTVPVCLPCPYMEKACEIFRHLFCEESLNGENTHFYFLSAVCRLLSLHAAVYEPQQSNPNTVYVRTIRNYIRDNYATIACEKELSDLVHLSTRYMHKIFKEETGTSPIRYLNRYRIQCAKRLLTETDLSVHTISDMVGFSNPNYFCCVFQRFCDGVSPLSYRKGER